MKRFGIAGLLVLLAHLLIGVWAFRQMQNPAHALDMLQLFAMC